jgi:DNA primase large subunit
VKQGLHDVLRGQMRQDAANDMLSLGAGGFYSVPFEEVADLVRGRRVYMAGGQAFVPRDQLASLVVGRVGTLGWIPLFTTPLCS